MTDAIAINICRQFEKLNENLAEIIKIMKQEQRIVTQEQDAQAAYQRLRTNYLGTQTCPECGEESLNGRHHQETCSVRWCHDHSKAKPCPLCEVGL